MMIFTIRELLNNHLRSLYASEIQLYDGITYLVEQVTLLELRELLETYAGETHHRIEWLAIEVDTSGIIVADNLRGMAGLVDESKHAARSAPSGDLSDLAVIAVIKKMAHYQIAAYDSAISIAETNDKSALCKKLREALREQEQVEQSLTVLFEEIIDHEAESRLLMSGRSLRPLLSPKPL